MSDPAPGPSAPILREVEGDALQERTRGLSSEEAAARLAREGRNVLVPTRKRAGAWRIVARALADPMVILLLVASATYFLLGDRTDAVVTFAAIVPIALISVLLERRAERALDALRALTSPTARGWRDGEIQTIPVEALVPGDLIEVQEGDVVPADGELVGGSLTADESPLTGESQPVPKTLEAGGATAEVFAGTVVSSGRGEILLRRTGSRTRYGGVAGLVARVEPPKTPLQRSIRRLTTQLGVVALGICGLVVALEVARGSPWGPALIAAVSLAIAAIPEEFPIVFTLYLSLGAWRLARGKALVRRLVGVETLGATTVICADKTGTLTQGRLALVSVALRDGTIEPLPARSARAGDLLGAAVLASEPRPYDALERAIASAAEGAGIDVSRLHAGTLVRDHAFDPRTKTMMHVWDDRAALTVCAKGALEGILDIARASEADRTAAIEANRRLADEGMRVLGVARGTLASSAGDRTSDASALRFEGLLAFRDPPREGVKEALEECQRAGIRVLMITGDHPVTAHAIAEGLGLPHEAPRPVVTGDDLDRVDDRELAAVVRETRIFARVRPEQKHRIVEALRAQGEVVAMTGDGINDAPALRAADIGIAMGERGTQVARESATLVLLDDNFSTIVQAVRNGRRLFANIQRAFAYILAFHPPLLFAALVIPLLDKPLFLLPLHLVWLELVMHPTASVVFEAEPAPEDAMRRPPRARGSSLVRRDLLLYTLIPGLVLAATSIALYLWALARGSVEHARAQALAAMLVGQALLVLVARADARPFWSVRTRNRTLLPILALTLATAVLAIHVPPVARLLALEPLSLPQWALAALVGSLSVLIVEPVKALRAGRARA